MPELVRCGLERISGKVTYPFVCVVIGHCWASSSILLVADATQLWGWCENECAYKGYPPRMRHQLLQQGRMQQVALRRCVPAAHATIFSK